MITKTKGVDAPPVYFKVGEYDFSYQINNSILIVTNETGGETEYHQYRGDERIQLLAEDIAMEMYNDLKNFLRTYK